MTETNEQITGNHRCIQCNEPIAEDARHCIPCGASEQDFDIEETERKQKTITVLAIFFAVHLLVCLVTNFTKYGRGIISLFVADGILSVFTIVYVVLFRKELKTILRWNNFSIGKTAGYALGAVTGAVIISYIVRWLNRTIFDADTHYYFAFSHLKYAKLVTILMVGLQPAIFEELAFRGVLQTGLNKVMDTRQAIFIAAFLFTLLHMSVITFLWLLPFALWLGYVRNKEDTLWYGMIIHFCFNATACLLEFFELHLF